MPDADDAGGDPLPRVLRTERLSLPLWSAEEAADVRAGRRREGWHRDYPRPEDRDAAALRRDGDPWGPRHVVRGATALGSVGFFGPPEPAADGVPEAEVGIGLVAEAHGWGFGSEALRAVLAAADAAAVRVRAAVEPSSAPSMRLLAGCGFTALRGADEDGLLLMARPRPGAPA